MTRPNPNFSSSWNTQGSNESLRPNFQELKPLINIDDNHAQTNYISKFDSIEITSSLSKDIGKDGNHSHSGLTDINKAFGTEREYVILISVLPLSTPEMKNIIYKEYSGYHLVSWSEIYQKVKQESPYTSEFEEVKEKWLKETSKRFFMLLRQRPKVLIVDELMKIEQCRMAFFRAIRKLYPSHDLSNPTKCKIMIWKPLFGQQQLVWYRDYLVALYDIQQLNNWKEIDNLCTDLDRYSGESDSQLINNFIEEKDIDIVEELLSLESFEDLNLPPHDIETRYSTLVEEKDHDRYPQIQISHLEETLTIDRNKSEFFHRGVIIDASAFFSWNNADHERRPKWSIPEHAVRDFLLTLCPSKSYSTRIIFIISEEDLSFGSIDDDVHMPRKIQYERIILKLDELNLPFPIYTIRLSTTYSISSTIFYLKSMYGLDLNQSIFIPGELDISRLTQVLQLGISIVKDHHSFIGYFITNLKSPTRDASIQKFQSCDEAIQSKAIIIQLTRESNMNLSTLIHYSPERSVFVSATIEKFPLCKQFEQFESRTDENYFTWQGYAYSHTIILNPIYWKEILTVNSKISFDESARLPMLIELLMTPREQSCNKYSVTQQMMNGVFDPEALLFLSQSQSESQAILSQPISESSNSTSEIVSVDKLEKYNYPQILMSFSSLGDRFGPLSFQRGRDYFTHNHIKDLSINLYPREKNTFKLYSSCVGSRDDPYKQETVFSNGILLRDKCTCPLERCCKHIVAQILQYLQYSSNDLSSITTQYEQDNNQQKKPIPYTLLDPYSLSSQTIRGTVTFRSDITVFANATSGEKATILIEDTEKFPNPSIARVLLFGESVRKFYDMFSRGNTVTIESFHVRKGRDSKFEISLTERSIVTKDRVQKECSEFSFPTKVDFSAKWNARLNEKQQEMFSNVDFDFVDEDLEFHHKKTANTPEKVDTFSVNHTTPSHEGKNLHPIKYPSPHLISNEKQVGSCNENHHEPCNRMCNTDQSEKCNLLLSQDGLPIEHSKRKLDLTTLPNVSHPSKRMKINEKNRPISQTTSTAPIIGPNQSNATSMLSLLPIIQQVSSSPNSITSKQSTTTTPNISTRKQNHCNISEREVFYIDDELDGSHNKDHTSIQISSKNGNNLRKNKLSRELKRKLL